jgi:SH3-like domain-containing protein
MMKINSYIFMFILFFICNDVLASITDLPKFMSIKVDEANLRAGPGTNFPIELIYVKKNLVIEVVDSFDNWYKIIDEEGSKGWLHKSLISKRRYFVTNIDGAKLYKNPHNRHEFLFLELGLRGRINSCRKDWCNVKFREYSGWLKKSEIWGVYPNEDF